MKLKYYILSLLLFCTSLLYADDIKFTATTNRTEVGTGEQFEVTFTVNGNGERFTPPDFNGFQVLSGPNESTSMTSINGTTTVETSISYILTPVRVGVLTIGPAIMIVNGKSRATNPIKITAIKGRPSATNPQGGNAQSAPDNTIEQGNTADLEKSLFIKAVVDKANVYQGQQVTLSYRLYTRVGIEQSQLDKLPDLNGFWSEDVKSPQQVQWRVETYKGLKYNVADIKQSILFPEHAGDLTIDPMAMTFIVRQPVKSNDIMDQFLGSYKEVKYSAKSAPVVIHARPLPQTGKPDSFTGAVGSFSIDASVDKTELKANESLNYTVKVTGSGNIKLLKTISTNFPPDFEKYDPKITDTTNERAGGVSGSRIYTYLLIPRHQGDFTIDPIKFSYFNPATNRYVTLTSKAFRIRVNKGIAENNVTALAGSDKQDVKMLNKDIRYIKTGDAELSQAGDAFFGSFGYYLLLFIGPVLCIAAYNYRNLLIRNNSDIVKVKGRNAGKIALKHLANAQKQLELNNTQAFYEDIFKGLYGYLSDKLNIPYANLDRETIASNLQVRALDTNVSKQLLDTLDLCEMARYAPVTHISKQEVFEKAKGIINDIESII
ncbi:BatD family protein [Mucilaginibacter sp.]|uniref:BatD family protein n=1 Tax=Mucilaginibacter sp. TaxID=1882438 RepID=UPI003D0F6B5E